MECYHSGIAREIIFLRLELIHTHTEFSLGIFGRMIANQLGIPTVHTMHTIYEHYTHYIARTGALDSAAKTLARKWSRHFCNTADAVIAPTEKVSEMLRVYGVRKKIAVIPTGIELGKFASARYGIDEGMTAANCVKSERRKHIPVIPGAICLLAGLTKMKLGKFITIILLCRSLLMNK